MVDAVAIPLAGVVAYLCGARAPDRRGLPIVLACAVLVQVAMGFANAPNVEILLGTLAPWLIGRELRRRRELIAALADRNAQLEAQEQRAARLSVRRERLRIAGELHDVVAHRLSMIVIQAQAGARAKDDATRAEFVDGIGRAAQQALAEIDQLVHVLDEDNSGGLRQLAVLLADAQRGGLALTWALPSDGVLPAELEDVAYRVVREGLTNAIKHAPGAALNVRVVAGDGGVDVEVSDTGASAVSTLAASGSGSGVSGLRRRVEALDGTLHAGPRPDRGWALRASVPRSGATTSSA